MGGGGGGNMIRECIGVQRREGSGYYRYQCYVCGIAEVCITARGLGCVVPEEYNCLLYFIRWYLRPF